MGSSSAADPKNTQQYEGAVKNASHKAAQELERRLRKGLPPKPVKK